MIVTSGLPSSLEQTMRKTTPFEQCSGASCKIWNGGIKPCPHSLSLENFCSCKNSSKLCTFQVMIENTPYKSTNYVHITVIDNMLLRMLQLHGFSFHHSMVISIHSYVRHHLDTRPKTLPRLGTCPHGYTLQRAWRWPANLRCTMRPSLPGVRLCFAIKAVNDTDFSTKAILATVQKPSILQECCMSQIVSQNSMHRSIARDRFALHCIVVQQADKPLQFPGDTRWITPSLGSPARAIHG